MSKVRVGDFAKWRDPKNVGVGYVTSVHKNDWVGVYWLDINAVYMHYIGQPNLKIIP